MRSAGGRSLPGRRLRLHSASEHYDIPTSRSTAIVPFSFLSALLTLHAVQHHPTNITEQALQILTHCAFFVGVAGGNARRLSGGSVRTRLGAWRR
jgi:hypothetical protein